MKTIYDCMNTLCQQLEQSPMFKFSLSSRELFHSNFLEWLSTVDKDAFSSLMNCLVDSTSCPIQWPKSGHWRVKREFQKLDLCVLSYDKKQDYDDDNDDNAKIILTVENKVKSIPYKEQLDDYSEKVVKWNKKKSGLKCVYLLLSLAKEFPEKSIIEKDHIWTIKNYDVLSSLITVHYLQNRLPSFETDIIKDYCKFVGNLSSLANIWYHEDFRLDSPFLYFYKSNNKRLCFQQYEELRRLRIHDLFQKLKFSYMCSLLFLCVKEVVGEGKALPNNGKGLFKSCNDERRSPRSSFVSVNYAFLHGEPLIEINIHPAVQNGQSEFYFTIQVQGNRYEHGVQIKLDASINNTEEVLKQLNPVISGYCLKNWMWTGKGEDKEKVIACKQKGLLQNDLLPNDPQGKLLFYKYSLQNGRYYIYQAREINTGTGENNKGPCIYEIMCQMLLDLTYVWDCIS